jgi:hypothetical protein
LMVSTFRYYSFKKLDLRRRWSYRVALPLAVIVGAVVYALTSSQLVPQAAFMLLALVYTLSGPATYLWNRLLRRRGKPAATPLPAAATPLLPPPDRPAPELPPAEHAAPPGKGLPADKQRPPDKADKADKADKKAAPDRKSPP